MRKQRGGKNKNFNESKINDSKKILKRQELIDVVNINWFLISLDGNLDGVLNGVLNV